jgi:SMI1/KNR4 family protein SUKH-1
VSPDVPAPALTTPAEWREYLREYLAAGVRAKMLDDDRWTGHPPATEEAVAAAEQRLGVRFPPSYRSFLLTTDGWDKVGCWIGLAYSCEEIVWLREDEEGWGEEFISLYSEEDGNAEYVEVFQRTLKITNGEDFWFLDPTEIDADGEWGAYVFRPKYGELERFPGFAHLWHENRRTFDVIAADHAAEK